MIKKQTIRFSQAHGSDQLSPFRFPLNESLIWKPSGEKVSVLDAVFHATSWRSNDRACPLPGACDESGRI